MKNSATAVLIAVTLAFAAFVGGFCLGRNYGSSDVEVSAFLDTSPSISPQTSSTSGQTSSQNPAPFSSGSPSASSASAPSATDTEATAAPTQANPFPININTATVEQLKQIKGIGDVIALRIIEYRNQIGQFQHVEELLDVKGIGEKTLEKIRPYITIEGGNP